MSKTRNSKSDSNHLSTARRVTHIGNKSSESEPSAHEELTKSTDPKTSSPPYIPKGFYIVAKTEINNQFGVHPLENGKSIISVCYYIYYEHGVATAHPHVYLMDNDSLTDISKRFRGLKEMGAINFSKEKDRIFSKYVPKMRTDSPLIGNRRIFDIAGQDENHLYAVIYRDMHPHQKLKASELWAYSKKRWKRVKRTKVMGRSYVSLQPYQNGAMVIERPELDIGTSRTPKLAKLVKHNLRGSFPKALFSEDDIDSESDIAIKMFEPGDFVVAIDNVPLNNILVKRWSADTKQLSSQSIENDNGVIEFDIKSPNLLTVYTFDSIVSYRFADGTWTKFSDSQAADDVMTETKVTDMFANAGLEVEDSLADDTPIHVWRTSDDIFYVTAMCPDMAPKTRCLYRNRKPGSVLIDTTPPPTLPKDVDESDDDGNAPWYAPLPGHEWE